MEAKKRKELEEKLRRIFEESCKEQAERPAAKAKCSPCSVIRRRKGMPDKRIEALPKEQ